jgi:late competence protein required for DNA uptake (superfamily II DNA/RNA helicase)
MQLLLDRIEDVSSVSMGEWVKIKTTLNVIHNERFQCSRCIRKHQGKRKDWEAHLEREQEAKACRSLKPEPFAEIDQQIFFTTCPGNFSYPEVLNWRAAFMRYQQGILPFPGSLMDQPNRVIELFQLFEADEMDRMIEERKRIEKQQRGGPSGR